MRKDLVTTIQEEIDSSAGDTTRLEFILDKIKEGTPLYECDRKYLRNRLLDNPQDSGNRQEGTKQVVAQRTRPKPATDQVHNHIDRTRSGSTVLLNLGARQSDDDSERIAKQTRMVEQMRSELHQMSVKLDRLEENIQEKKRQKPAASEKRDYGPNPTRDKKRVEFKPQKTLEIPKSVTEKPTTRLFAKALLVITLATLATLFTIFALFNMPATRAGLENYGITYDQIKTITNWMLPILVIILANWSLCAYMFLVETKRDWLQSTLKNQ